MAPRQRSGSTPTQRSRSVRAVDKAIFHNVTGAGKTHVLRPFFGLSPADEQAIEDELGVAIDVNIEKDGGSNGA